MSRRTGPKFRISIHNIRTFKGIQMKRPYLSSIAGCAFALFLIGSPGSRAGSLHAPTFEEMATARVSDLEASVNVDKADQEELKKIGKDFGMAYRLKNV